MDLKRQAFFLSALACSAISNPLWAKKFKQKHYFKLWAGYVASTYQESAASENKGTSEDRSEIDLTGSQVTMAFTYSQYELDVQYTSYTPKEQDHWENRSDLNVQLSYYNRWVPWVATTFGYFQMSQTGDPTHSNAPPAFLSRNTAFSMGLHIETLPFIFGKKKHGVLFISRYHYLTTFERTRNFGNEYQAGLGYAYLRGKGKKKMQLGLFAAAWHNQTFAEQEDPDAPGKFISVRSQLDGYTVNLFFRL